MKKILILPLLFYNISYSSTNSSFIQQNIDNFEKNNQYKKGWTSIIAWGIGSYEYDEDGENFEWFCYSDSTGIYHAVANLELSVISQKIIKFIFPWISRNYEGDLSIDFTEKLVLVTIDDGWYDSNCKFFHNKEECRKMSINHKIRELSDMPTIKYIKIIEYF